MYGSCDREITNGKCEFVLIKANITEKYMQCIFFLTGSFEGEKRGVYTAWCSRICMLGKVESLVDEGLG